MTAFVFPPFENHNGHLVLENLDLVDLIDKMGSPLLVVSEDKIRENYRKLDRVPGTKFKFIGKI